MPRGGKRPGAGRPRGSRNRATVAAGGRTLTELARDLSPSMLGVLAKIAADPTMSPSARVAAANSVLDRGPLPRVRPAENAPPAGATVVRIELVQPPEEPQVVDRGLRLVEAQ